MEGLQIEAMNNLKDTLPEKFYDKIVTSLEFIIKEVSQVEEIYLFGSCARREQKWDSDIDLAIITNEIVDDHYLRGYVIDTLDEESEHGVSADVIFRTNNMHDISKTFKQVFDMDKILLWKRGD